MIKPWMNLFPMCISMRSDKPFYEEKKTLMYEDLRSYYPGLELIEYFGGVAGGLNIELYGIKTKEKLNRFELNTYLESRFKKNFGHIKNRRLNREDRQKISLDPAYARTVGLINFRIWVAGDTYPMPTHIKWAIGNWENPDIYSSEFLGVQSEETIEKQIKLSIDHILEDMARAFFKLRGEL